MPYEQPSSRRYFSGHPIYNALLRLCVKIYHDISEKDYIDSPGNNGIIFIHQIQQVEFDFRPYLGFESYKFFTPVLTSQHIAFF